MNANPVAVVITKITPADHDYPTLLADTLREFSWHVVLFPSANIDGTPTFNEKFSQLLNSTQARVVFSINFTSILGDLAIQLPFTYVAWNEVYPLRYELKTYPLNEAIWVFESSKSMTEWWREKNVKALFYPMGFDERLFKPRSTGLDIDISMVGNGLFHYEKLFQDLQKQAVDALNNYSYQNNAIKSLAIKAIATFLETIQKISFQQFERQGHSVEEMIHDYCDTLKAPEEVCFAVRETLQRSTKCLMGYYARRQRLESLQAVSPLGRLQVFGRDWEGTPVAKYAKPPLSFADTAEIFSRSRLSLHIQRFYAQNINDRLLNVPAAGGFLLTRATEEIADIFEPQKEIALFTTVEDLAEKARYFLAHAAERQSMAEQACRRVHSHYRFRQRLWEVLGICGLPRPTHLPQPL